ncbi:MAG TPA: nuclear transport factor 2 family protein, partial [Acidimicrobiales bacterium]|nr:nuclear transport factor 2 family protein [Acidimicrobiales bacterium]
ALAHSHISSLLGKYYQAIDTANWPVLDQEVLADGAVWEVIQHSPSGETIEDTVKGRPDIVNWFEQIMGGGASMSEGTCRHFVSTHVIDVDGDTARSSSHLQAFDTHTFVMLSNGVVEADHVKTDRGWRIRRYHIDEDITEADMEAFKQAVPR